MLFLRKNSELTWPIRTWLRSLGSSCSALARRCPYSDEASVGTCFVFSWKEQQFTHLYKWKLKLLVHCTIHWIIFSHLSLKVPFVNCCWRCKVGTGHKDKNWVQPIHIKRRRKQKKSLMFEIFFFDLFCSVFRLFLFSCSLSLHVMCDVPLLFNWTYA